MTREEVFVSLEEIFTDLLDDPAFKLTEDASMDTLEKWDSLFHITLIASVEAEFGIRFQTEQIAEIKNARALTDIILLELNKK